MTSRQTMDSYIEKIRHAPTMHSMGQIIVRYPSLIFSQYGVAAILQQIPRTVKKSNEREIKLYFIQAIIDTFQKKYTNAYSFNEYGDVEGNTPTSLWPIDILRCYIGSVIDQSDGRCLESLVTEDNNWYVKPMALDNVYEYTGFIMMLFDFNIQTGYSKQVWEKYVSIDAARVGFLNVFADCCASLYNRDAAVNILSHIWSDHICNREESHMKWPFIEILHKVNIGMVQEDALPYIDQYNEKLPEWDRMDISECISDISDLFVHLSNIIQSDFSRQTYLFEYLSMIAFHYSIQEQRQLIANRYDKYFGNDVVDYMADITDAIITNFGALDAFCDEAIVSPAYTRVAKVSENIILHIELEHGDVSRRVVELFFKDTLKAFGYGFDGAALGAMNAIDAIIASIYKRKAELPATESYTALDSIEARYESYEAMEADVEKIKETGTTTIDNLTKHARAKVKPAEALKSAERKISNGFHKYKEAEQNIDSQLSKGIGMLKTAITGDQRTILVEGKQFSPIGFFKKVIGTVAIFNYSKIGFILALIVKKAMTRKTKVTERRKLVQELEEELLLVNEKIDDARGDGNREAKYALMRSKAALENAIKRIKYGIGAETAKGPIKTETTGYRG